MAENGCQTSSLFFLLVFVSALRFECLEAGLVPGIYVFGDSLIDAGNNNYLKLSILKANYPHNGVDFPNKKPTGRFCNGKNTADFLAEKVGLATSPPYLSLTSKLNPPKNKTAAFVAGVNFASGGAGIMNETNQIFRQSLSLTQQVDYFSGVSEELAQRLGAPATQLHLSKSIFLVVIGSNDIFGYSDSSDLRKKYTIQQYVDSMTVTLEGQLKRLYNQGARKFVMVGIPALGCIPMERKKNNTEECNSEINQWGLLYNEELKSMLQKLKTEFSDVHYSYANSYAAISNIIQSPSSFGFVEIKAACCGVGKLNADIPCLPISTLCSNRLDHLFWDLYHPTEAAHRIIADIIFDGPSVYTFPFTMKQLISV